MVSLQWEVADASVAHGASADEMWERAALAELAGRPCSTLERADLLQLLCVRGTVKRWHRLAWVREVADLMVEADPRELEDALTRATRRGARRALALGSSLAGRMLGAPLPLGFADAARDGAVVELGTAVIEETAAAARALPGPSHIARFHLRTRERVSDKLRYAIRRATLPGPDAASALRVPAPLLPFAYALTSVRRVVRAGRQWRLRTRRRRGGKLARFGRTPAHVVDRMLALAGASEADTVFDLGCGDGAIVIRAAQRLGCRGVGVELDAELIEAARVNAREAGVERLVEFHRADVREMDLGAATIVCVYLNAAANLTLRPLLQRGLRPGTRLVSFNFTMGDWWPDEVEILDETSWGSNTLYLWHIDPDTAARAAA